MNGPAFVGDERGKRLDIAVQEARFQSAVLRGFRDERNDGISDWRRWLIGVFLLADDPDAKQRAAPPFVGGRHQQ